MKLTWLFYTFSAKKANDDVKRQYMSGRLDARRALLRP
jgi:hypothetical protein